MNNLMIDWETLSTKPNAVVLTIGMVEFNHLTDEIYNTQYFRIETDQQISDGRHVCDGTMQWWALQSPEAQEEAFSEHNRFPLDHVMDELSKVSRRCTRIWSHGSIFDIVIAENIYNQFQLPIPWKFWMVRDTRTLFDLADPEMDNSFKHDALADAIHQAVGVQAAYRKLGISK